MWGACCHPTQMYEIIFGTLLLAFIRVLWKKNTARIEGTIFLTFVGLSSGACLSNEAFRKIIIEITVQLGEKVTAQIGFEVHLETSYEQAVERGAEALKTEGFGVLTTIDVRATESTEDGSSLIRIMNPEYMMKAGSLEGDPVILEVAREACQRLERVAEGLRSQ